MDQPANEIVRLEKILDAFVKVEEREAKRSETRDKNRRRHEPVRVKTEENA